MPRSGRRLVNKRTLLRYSLSITDCIIPPVILAFSLVFAYDLLEERRTINVIKFFFFPPCFKMAEMFENLDLILRNWVEDKVHTRLVKVLNKYEEQEERMW